MNTLDDPTEGDGYGRPGNAILRPCTAGSSTQEKQLGDGSPYVTRVYTATRQLRTATQQEQQQRQASDLSGSRGVVSKQSGRATTHLATKQTMYNKNHR